MTQKQASASGAASVARTVGVGVVFTAVVVVLLLWLAGVFAPKVGTGEHGPAAVAGRPVGNTPLVAARLVKIPATEPAVGTVRAVHETSVASKLLAKVIAVNAQAGQAVRKGDVLARLDDEDLTARLRQADAAVAAATAARDQARIEYERVNGLYEQGNASQVEWERADTARKTADAELERAQQGRSEAQTNVDYATVRSPIDGTVVDKRVEAGDTAAPGQVLVTLYDPDRMQLVARVRESLAQRLQVGQEIGVRIDALTKTCAGSVSEIVPEAETASRSFSVKVTGPCPPGVYSGMFGRLLIPLDDEEVLLIPRQAVRHIGQLDVVDVAEAAGDQRVLRRRSVQLGRGFDEDVEVLAGLKAGEQVALPLTQTPTGERSNG